jgi:lipid-A-disaccharide synthase
MERLSVMGFIEPLGRLPELLRLKRDLVDLYVREQPTVFIGIDSPGFNLRLEQSLRDAGIPTVHYVSPSVWAWAEGRIRKIAKAVDLMLTLFPFETAIYEKNNISVRCVGHFLADLIEPDGDQAVLRIAAQSALGLVNVDNAGAQQPLVCLMPGSRRDEVMRLAPVFIETALTCLAQRPAMRFIIPCANSARREQIALIVAQMAIGHPEAAKAFELIDGQSHLAMQAADLVMLASGTATLEAMLLKRPMIVCYKLSAFTWALASRLVKVPYVSLPNLLAGRELVPEFLQGEVNATALSREMFTWLDDSARQQSLYKVFDQIHRDIRRDASRQAAETIAAFIEERQSVRQSP